MLNTIILALYIKFNYVLSPQVSSDGKWSLNELKKDILVMTLWTV